MVHTLQNIRNGCQLVITCMILSNQNEELEFFSENWQDFILQIKHQRPGCPNTSFA
jgi:hypothetical protein